MPTLIHARLLLAGALLLPAACNQRSQVEPVEPQRVSMRNSPKLDTPPPATTMAAGTEKVCYWNDKKYSDGATVCDSKTRYKCWAPKWVELGNC